MNKKHWAGVAVGGIVIVVAVAVLAPMLGSQGDEVKVGVVGPFSGGPAPDCTACQSGMDHAQETG